MEPSPFTPSTYPTLPAIEGVRLSSTQCGVKYRHKADVFLAVFEPGTHVAGVFTRSLTASANIDWGREALTHGTARALVVNSGNANAFNGRAGEESVERIVHACSQLLDCSVHEVYPCATGVIGEPLSDHLITDSLQTLYDHLTDDDWDHAAEAIMTTDTYKKMATRSTNIDGVPVTLNGITKGSGMIAPDMATMLAYIFTDAHIAQPVLQQLLSEYVGRSFNAITVDSDTSTSDTALLFATGKASHDLIDSVDDPRLDEFKAALADLLLELAHLIVKDGEGATKFVAVHVTGAASDGAAKRIGLSIANSPLVKTALAGEDPNWGRIVMAVGKSGEAARRELLTVGIGDAVLAKQGQLNPDYVEAPTAEYMKGDHIDIHVDIGIGQGSFTVWTCDLTHQYITINADYRS